MSEINLKHMPFRGVALGIIILGAAIMAISAVAWMISFGWGVITLTAPFSKLIGGAVITALGYVVLELELMRCSK